MYTDDPKYIGLQQDEQESVGVRPHENSRPYSILRLAFATLPYVLLLFVSFAFALFVVQTRERSTSQRLPADELFPDCKSASHPQRRGSFITVVLLTFEKLVISVERLRTIPTTNGALHMRKALHG